MADYAERYGAIVAATFRSYYKYVFEIEIKTALGYTLAVTTGGDRIDIYRYDPESTEWDEHIAAVVQSVDVIVAPPVATTKTERDEPALESCSSEEEKEQDPLATVLRAMLFATRAHRDQRRKTPTQEPYIVHPVSAAVHLIDSGVRDPDVLAAALLHDTVEDTPVTFAQLHREFGPRITALVVEVSDDKAQPKAERKREQVRHATHLSPGAQLVKMAGAYDNMVDMLGLPPAEQNSERVLGYFVWKERVLRGFCPPGGKKLRARLDDLFCTALPDGVMPQQLDALLNDYYAAMERVDD